MSTETMTPNAAGADSWKDYEAKPQSFGDKWGKKLHWFLTDIGVNYLVNVTISVGMTYAFEKTLGERYNNWLESAVKNLPDLIKGPAKFMTKFATKSQILLMGGHTLIPFMKYFREHEHEETASLGNKLDGIAATLGFGGDASRQNRADYTRLRQLMNDKPKDVTEEDARILSKFGVNDKFEFIEEKKKWSDVLISRFRAMMYSLVTNAGLGFIESKTLNETGKGLYNRGWANPISSGKGPWPGLSKIFGKIPGFKRAFPDGELFGREYANDMILTAASTIGFMQGMDNSDKKGPNHEELRAQNAALWSERVARVSAPDVSESSRRNPAKEILAQDRPADQQTRVETERTEQEAAPAARG